MELANPSDAGPRGLTALRRKMATYQANGAQLSWPASGACEPQRLEAATNQIDAGPLFAGLRIDLHEI